MQVTAPQVGRLDMKNWIGPIGVLDARDVQGHVVPSHKFEPMKIGSKGLGRSGPEFPLYDARYQGDSRLVGEARKIWLDDTVVMAAGVIYDDDFTASEVWIKCNGNSSSGYYVDHIYLGFGGVPGCAIVSEDFAKGMYLVKVPKDDDEERPVKAEAE